MLRLLCISVASAKVWFVLFVACFFRFFRFFRFFLLLWHRARGVCRGSLGAAVVGPSVGGCDHNHGFRSLYETWVSLFLRVFMADGREVFLWATPAYLTPDSKQRNW